MKKVLLSIVLGVTATLLFGQKSIDELFDKYAGRNGFTTVTINGNLLKLAHFLGDKDDENTLPADITEIRVLAQEDNTMKVENFYDLVISDIDLKNYDEFMRVKKSDQDMRMLVRTEGKRFREFLLIAGGENNAVIQIKGNMSFDEARKFSEDAKKDHGASKVELYK
jgi:hypothetical protein